MSNEPISGDSDELSALKKENAELRQKLEHATKEAKEYRAAAYDFLDQIYPYTRPTEAELHEMMQSDPIETLHDIIAEFKRELV